MIRALTLLLLCGCNTDRDDDGLSNKAEEILGTDPDVVDTDKDGLSDAEEVELGLQPLNPDTDEDGLLDGEEVDVYGTDPLNPDSDLDGYLDLWEVTEGSDPLDPDSRIYTGNWPYNPDKGAIDPSLSETLPPWELTDVYGELVHMYDMASPGTVTVIHLASAFTGTSAQLDEYAAGRPNAITTNWPSVAVGSTCVGEGVASGAVRWITVLVDGPTGAPATADDALAWQQEHEHPRMLVSYDHVQAMQWSAVESLPALIIVDGDDMSLVTASDELENLSQACATLLD